MLVSWDWLRQYVSVNDSVDTVSDRLTMSGLNLEEFHAVDDDVVIDLEVTSNRPDCLGHLGIAREVAALYDTPLKLPAATPKESATPASSAVSVKIDCPDLCPQYIARVIKGAKIGPSPAWMQKRLATVGIAAINNVVDITNYVMLECAQPLHAFDYDKLDGRQIIVRKAATGEKLKAINQKEYALTTDQCVIADAKRPVALAGVMGGFDTEISSSTKTVLIEAASFAPLSIRSTARKLDLHSPSSYRFERALDPNGPEWASRRCCELILELAGGELLSGSVVAGATPAATGPEITLRFGRFRKVLGIDIPVDAAVRILGQLGLKLVGQPTAESAKFIAPSYRRDLTREIDLIEEVARLYGYDKLPADIAVPLCTSAKSPRERVVERIGETLTAAGYFEAITSSFTSDAERKLFQPQGDQPALTVEHSSRRAENQLRQSLVPSLLASRRANERQGNFSAQLFEVAKVFLKADPTQPERDAEPWRIGLVTGRGYLDLKGVVQLLAQRINPKAKLTVRPSSIAQFTPGRGAEVYLNDRLWGWMGELDRSASDAADLRDAVCVAELDLIEAETIAEFIPRAEKLPDHPGMTRDLNFVLDEPVEWSAVETTVRQSAGPLLESVHFGGQYRGKQLGDDKKSYVVSMTFRAADRTLTSDEVDTAQKAVIAACESQLKAALRA
ncbi:MAG TPA: phenylalanine--tRNA ligase subunit beta [Planctomycetaceae bacterium]|nr:phenylalanine--tRNA ligase subunit beta [Planctomycetaceae bacterium]